MFEMLIDRFYLGKVESFDSRKNKHEVSLFLSPSRLIFWELTFNLVLKIDYDDGDVEFLHLDKERWELVAPPSEKVLFTVNPLT